MVVDTERGGEEKVLSPARHGFPWRANSPHRRYEGRENLIFCGPWIRGHACLPMRSCERPPSSKGGEKNIYSPAASVENLPASNGGRGETFLHAGHEFEFTALTARACSCVSASAPWIRHQANLPIACKESPSSKNRGKMFTTQLSTFPQRSPAPLPQSPRLVTWCNGGPKTFRKENMASRTDAYTTFSTTHTTQFGLITQVTTTGFISPILNARRAFTVDVTSRIEYNAPHSDVPSSSSLLYLAAAPTAARFYGEYLLNAIKISQHPRVYAGACTVV